MRTAGNQLFGSRAAQGRRQQASVHWEGRAPGVRALADRSASKASSAAPASLPAGVAPAPPWRAGEPGG